MNRLKLNNFNGITEFKNELKSSDIKIWIYTLPVKDLDKKHRENYDNIKFLKKENKNIFPYIPNMLKRVCDYGNLASRILSILDIIMI